MPFQSEKQRRYLWANEPEIARDWTDTYGSGIAKALGGRINYLYGGITHPGGRRGFPGGSGRAGDRAMPTGGSGANYGGPPGGGDRQMTYTAPVNRHTGPTTQEALITGQKKKEMRDLLARQQAEKEYTRQGVRKVGPQLGLAGSGIGGGGLKNFLGNWGSTVGGSQLGGGLGSMLFGPWGMLLGSIFGGGAGRRAWKAGQTPEKERLRDILMPEAMRNFFDKRINEQPKGQGIQGIDLSDMRDKRSAKDYIDLDKSYSEFDTIPSEYEGANLAKFISNKKDFPLHGKVVGDWDKGLGDFEYEQPEEWSTQDFPVRSDFYPGNVTKTYETGTGQNTLADWLGTTKYSDTRW